MKRQDDRIAQLERMLARGCFLPAAREHALLMLRIAKRREGER